MLIVNRFSINVMSSDAALGSMKNESEVRPNKKGSIGMSMNQNK